MRYIIFSVCIILSLALTAQSEKPPYCSEAMDTDGSQVDKDSQGAARPALPVFTSVPARAYKIQVAILRFTDPTEYPFHPSLVARFRPCEQVWVIESRESFDTRAAAVALRADLRSAGYESAFITELVAYREAEQVPE